MFADIKGSIELMEELDPEEARAIVDPALWIMIDAVRHYECYVEQSTGDGVFALFGRRSRTRTIATGALCRVAHAGRVAPRLFEGGCGWRNPDRSTHRGEHERSRSAIDHHQTSQTEYTPIGHTTHLASRMQAVAPISSIAISEQTRKFVDEYFLLKALGPTRVKGVSASVNVL